MSEEPWSVKILPGISLGTEEILNLTVVTFPAVFRNGDRAACLLLFVVLWEKMLG